MSQKQYAFDKYLSQRSRLELRAVPSFFAGHWLYVGSPHVRIAYVTPEFHDEFGSIVEHNVPAGVVSLAQLIRPATNRQLLSLGITKRKSHLSDLKQLLELQPNGEPGRLPANNRACICYLEGGRTRRLLAVSVRWSVEKHGWTFACERVDSPVGSWSMLDFFVHR